MLPWSKVVQPPEFLEATRTAFLNDDFAPFVVRYAEIRDGMRLLEAGCGTGYLSRYISRITSRIHFTGLDQDEGFLAAAKPVSGDNTCEYLRGSVYEMPFADASFDGVISHTLFNCLDDPKAALAEMRRVCSPGGRITTITSMSLSYEAWHTGIYPKECTWQREIAVFQSRMNKAIYQMEEVPRAVGYSLATASRIPRFFYQEGLRGIQMIPLPRCFSLSDVSIPRERKEYYVENLYIGERKKIENLMELTGICEKIPEEECRSYIEALRARRDFWMDHLDDNGIWDWFGAAGVLISGVN